MEFESGPDRKKRSLRPEIVKMDHGARAEGTGGATLVRSETGKRDGLHHAVDGNGFYSREAARREREETDSMLPERFALTHETNYLLPYTGPALRSSFLASRGNPLHAGDTGFHQAPGAFGTERESRALLYREPDSRAKVAAVDRFAALSYLGAGEEGEKGEDGRSVEPAPDQAYTDLSFPLPAWLDGAADCGEEEGEGTDAFDGSSHGETLQGSRERMASKRLSSRLGVATEEPGGAEILPATAPKDARMPLLAVFSLAGGVGKTSLVATLGRTLASLGERVLLVDTTPHGLLPFYFGASELRPSVIRTVRLPAEVCSAAIDLVSLDVLRQNPNTAEEWLHEELSRSSRAATRILLDTSIVTPWIVRLLARLGAGLLVPVSPDMNSVITLSAVEEFCTELQDSLGQAVQPWYLLNGFDASQSLHLDVRQLLSQRLGERLLPFVIRRSPEIPEALAESMTVVDYAEGTPVTSDFLFAADWVKKQTGGMAQVAPTTRWSEA